MSSSPTSWHGAYLFKDAHPPVFRPVAGPGANELQRLVEQIAVAVGAGPLDDLIGHSITYRIAVGPRAGQRLFTLQTVPPRLPGPEGDANGAARAGGFSLHAGIDIQSAQREKLERLCRYVSRPPVATERLALTASGQVRYTLKTPYRDGTTHLVLEPLELMARLATLVTPPRRGRGAKPSPVEPGQPPTPRHVAMSWAQRLKRVFGLEIDTCQRCGGNLRIIASIEQPEVIARILAHLERTSPQQHQTELPLGARAPPVPSRLR